MGAGTIGLPYCYTDPNTGEVTQKCPNLKPCYIEGGSCTLTFTYVDVNSIQDDSFDFYLVKSDGSSVKIGNLNGKCSSTSGDNPCVCSKVDTYTFDYTIDDSFVTSNACTGVCEIRFFSKMVASNSCGTFATFTITGPKGTGFGGLFGGNGTIDIEKCCPTTHTAPDANAS